MTRRTLTPPHRLEHFSVIIRAMGGNGAADQRAALNELYRRRLWLGDGQDSHAIRVAGLTPPDDRDERRIVLTAMGYGPAPVPLDARPPLPVIFRADRSGDFKGQVTAFFPTLPGDPDPWTCTCYAHVGQHGSASVDYYRTTRAATEAESADLLAELRRIYERDDDPDAVRLVPVKRWTRHHDAERKAELDRMRNVSTRESDHA